MSLRVASARLRPALHWATTYNKFQKKETTAPGFSCLCSNSEVIKYMYIRTIQLSKLLVQRHGGLILNSIIKKMYMLIFWRWGRGSFLSVFWCYLLEPGQVFILLLLKSDEEADTSFLKIFGLAHAILRKELWGFFFALAKPKHKSKETVSNNADKCRLFFIDTSVLSEVIRWSIKNQFLANSPHSEGVR